MVSRVFSGALTTIVVLAVCGCGPRPEPVSPLPAEPAALAADEVPATPWERCVEGFVATGDPEADIAGLGKSCGARLGHTPITDVRMGAQGEADAVDRFMFTAVAGKCYRVIAVGGSGIRDLDVQVVAADGRVMGADDGREGWAMVPLREPLCVREGGTLVVEASVGKGTGRYALQVWGGPRS